MKTIDWPSNSDFIEFDKVGLLIAIAEYSDEAMVSERMRHDWLLGSDLVRAFRHGELRVRDARTRFLIDPSAPSIQLLTSIVAVEEFRAFVKTLGYTVQVRSDRAKLLKRRVLVEFLKNSWPSIESDLREASRNGLKAFAHADKGWDPDRASQWAGQNCKLRKLITPSEASDPFGRCVGRRGLGPFSTVE